MGKHAAEGKRPRKSSTKHGYLDMSRSERLLNSHWPFTALLMFWLFVAAWAGFHAIDSFKPMAWLLLVGVSALGTLTTSIIGMTALNRLGWRRGYLRGLEWHRLSHLPEEHPDRLEHLHNVQEFK